MIDNPSEENLIAISLDIVERSKISNFALSNEVEHPVGMVSYMDFVEDHSEMNGMAQIGLKVFQQAIQLQSYQCSAAISREQIQDLSKIGIDAISQVETVIINESSQSLIKHAFDIIDLEAEKTHMSTYSKWELWKFKTLFPFLNKIKWINLPTTKFTKLPGNNIHEKTRALFHRILVESNRIATSSRRGPASFAIMNGQLGTAIQDISEFNMNTKDSPMVTNPGQPYLIGSISGIDIYIDPYKSWNDTTIIVGRKPKDGEPGLTFNFMPKGSSLMTIAERTMAPKITFRSRYAMVMVGDNPSKNYSKLYIDVTGL